MSDIADSTLSRSTLVLLKDDTNYPAWYRSCRGLLVQKKCSDAARTPYTPLIIPTTAGDPSAVPLPPSASEQAAFKERELAVSVIMMTLSPYIQDRIPPHLVDWDMPNPKALLDYLFQEYSATSSSRQAELYQIAWGTRSTGIDDILLNIGLVTSAFNEILASTPPTMTARQMIDGMHSHAILLTLPSSLSNFASTIYHMDDISVQDVTRRIGFEVRRLKGEDGNAALVAGRTAVTVRPSGGGGSGVHLGKDGKKMFGWNENHWCDEHKAYGHLTARCHKKMLR